MKKHSIVTNFLLLASSTVLLSGCSSNTKKTINNIENNIKLSLEHNENLKKDMGLLTPDSLKVKFTGYEVFEETNQNQYISDYPYCFGENGYTEKSEDKNQILALYCKVTNKNKNSYSTLTFSNFDTSKYDIIQSKYTAINALIKDNKYNYESYKLQNLLVDDFEEFDELFENYIPSYYHGYELDEYEALNIKNFKYNSETQTGNINTYLTWSKGFLSNGTVFFIEPFKDDTTLSNNIIHGVLDMDLNGVDTPPNRVGEDFFYFWITDKGIIPRGTPDSTEGQDFENKCLDVHSACTAWVLANQNLDYLHCPEKLGWNKASSCK